MNQTSKYISPQLNSQVLLFSKSTLEQDFTGSITVASNDPDDLRFDFRLEKKSKRIKTILLNEKFKLTLNFQGGVKILNADEIFDPNWKCTLISPKSHIDSKYLLEWIGDSNAEINSTDLFKYCYINNLHLGIKSNEIEEVTEVIQKMNKSELITDLTCQSKTEHDAHEGPVRILNLELSVIDIPKILEGFKSSFCWLNGNEGQSGKLWAPYRDLSDVKDDDWFSNDIELVLVWTSGNHTNTTMYIDFPIYGSKMPDKYAMISDKSIDQIKVSLDSSIDNILHKNGWTLKNLGIKSLNDVNYQRWQLEISKKELEKVPNLKSIYISKILCPHSTDNGKTSINLSWKETEKNDDTNIDEYTIHDIPKLTMPVITLLTAEKSNHYLTKYEDSEILYNPKLEDIKLSWKIVPEFWSDASKFDLVFDIDSNNNPDNANIYKIQAEEDFWSNTKSLSQLLRADATFNDKNEEGGYSSLREYKFQITLRDTDKVLLGKTLKIKYSHILYVNQKNESSGLNDGLKWETAYKNLDDAIDNAKDGDHIWIAQGTYLPSMTKDGSKLNEDQEHFVFYTNKNISLFGGFRGDEINLEQRRISQHPTIISGDYNDTTKVKFRPDGKFSSLENNDINPRTLLIIAETCKDIHIDGIQFRGAHARDKQDSTIGIYGKSINHSNLRLFVKNCVFKYNRAYESICELAYIKANFINCSFIENQIIQSVINDGTEGEDIDTIVETFKQCYFSNNYIGQNGIFNIRTSLINHCTFINNSIHDSEMGIIDNFMNSVFINNETSDSLIYTKKGEISNLLFYNNHCILSGYSALFYTSSRDNDNAANSYENISFLFSNLHSESNVIFVIADEKNISVTKCIFYGTKREKDRSNVHFGKSPKLNNVMSNNILEHAYNQPNLDYTANKVINPNLVNDLYNFRTQAPEAQGKGFQFADAPKSTIELHKKTYPIPSNYVVGLKKLFYDGDVISIGHHQYEDQLELMHVGFRERRPAEAIANVLYNSNSDCPVQFGTYEIDNPQAASTTIDFAKPFNEAPVVIAWISAMNLFKDNRKFKVSITQEDDNNSLKSRFSLHVDTELHRMGSLVNKVSWIALPSNLPNICAGKVLLSNKNTSEINRENTLNVIPVRFPSTFKTSETPTVLVGVSQIDLAGDIISFAVDVIHVDQEGFLLQIGSWSDTLMNECEVSYIAFEKYGIFENT